MKRNILLVCLFALIIVLFACSRSITGIYVSVDSPNIYLELNPDGTCSLEKNGKHFSGEYKVEDNIITLKLLTEWVATKDDAITAKLRAGFVREVKIQGNTITDDKGEKWIKQRKTIKKKDS